MDRTSYQWVQGMLTMYLGRSGPEARKYLKDPNLNDIVISFLHSKKSVMMVITLAPEDSPYEAQKMPMGHVKLTEFVIKDKSITSVRSIVFTNRIKEGKTAEDTSSCLSILTRKGFFLGFMNALFNVEVAGIEKNSEFDLYGAKFQELVARIIFACGSSITLQMSEEASTELNKFLEKHPNINSITNSNKSLISAFDTVIRGWTSVLNTFTNFTIDEGCPVLSPSFPKFETRLDVTQPTPQECNDLSVSVNRIHTSPLLSFYVRWKQYYQLVTSLSEQTQRKETKELIIILERVYGAGATDGNSKPQTTIREWKDAEKKVCEAAEWVRTFVRGIADLEREVVYVTRNPANFPMLPGLAEAFKLDDIPVPCIFALFFDVVPSFFTKLINYMTPGSMFFVPKFLSQFVNEFVTATVGVINKDITSTGRALVDYLERCVLADINSVEIPNILTTTAASRNGERGGSPVIETMKGINKSLQQHDLIIRLRNLSLLRNEHTAPYLTVFRGSLTVTELLKTIFTIAGDKIEPLKLIKDDIFGSVTLNMFKNKQIPKVLRNIKKEIVPSRYNISLLFTLFVMKMYGHEELLKLIKGYIESVKARYVQLYKGLDKPEPILFNQIDDSFKRAGDLFKLVKEVVFLELAAQNLKDADHNQMISKVLDPVGLRQEFLSLDIFDISQSCFDEGACVLRKRIGDLKAEVINVIRSNYENVCGFGIGDAVEEIQHYKDLAREDFVKIFARPLQNVAEMNGKLLDAINVKLTSFLNSANLSDVTHNVSILKHMRRVVDKHTVPLLVIVEHSKEFLSLESCIQMAENYQKTRERIERSIETIISSWYKCVVFSDISDLPILKTVGCGNDSKKGNIWDLHYAPNIQSDFIANYSTLLKLGIHFIPGTKTPISNEFKRRIKRAYHQLQHIILLRDAFNEACRFINPVFAVVSPLIMQAELYISVLLTTVKWGSISVNQFLMKVSATYILLGKLANTVLYEIVMPYQQLIKWLRQPKMPIITMITIKVCMEANTDMACFRVDVIQEVHKRVKLFLISTRQKLMEGITRNIERFLSFYQRCCVHYLPQMSLIFDIKSLTLIIHNVWKSIGREAEMPPDISVATTYTMTDPGLRMIFVKTCCANIVSNSLTKLGMIVGKEFENATVELYKGTCTILRDLYVLKRRPFFVTDIVPSHPHYHYNTDPRDVQSALVNMIWSVCREIFAPEFPIVVDQNLNPLPTVASMKVQGLAPNSFSGRSALRAMLCNHVTYKSIEQDMKNVLEEDERQAKAFQGKYNEALETASKKVISIIEHIIASKKRNAELNKRKRRSKKGKSKAKAKEKDFAEIDDNAIMAKEQAKQAKTDKESLAGDLYNIEKQIINLEKLKKKRENIQSRKNLIIFFPFVVSRRLVSQELFTETTKAISKISDLLGLGIRAILSEQGQYINTITRTLGTVEASLNISGIDDMEILKRLNPEKIARISHKIAKAEESKEALVQLKDIVELGLKIFFVKSGNQNTLVEGDEDKLNQMETWSSNDIIKLSTTQGIINSKQVTLVGSLIQKIDEVILVKKADLNATYSRFKNSFVTIFNNILKELTSAHSEVATKGPVIQFISAADSLAKDQGIKLLSHDFAVSVLKDKEKLNWLMGSANRSVEYGLKLKDVFSSLFSRCMFIRKIGHSTDFNTSILAERVKDLVTIINSGNMLLKALGVLVVDIANILDLRWETFVEFYHNKKEDNILNSYKSKSTKKVNHELARSENIGLICFDNLKEMIRIIGNYFNEHFLLQVESIIDHNFHLTNWIYLSSLCDETTLPPPAQARVSDFLSIDFNSRKDQMKLEYQRIDFENLVESHIKTTMASFERNIFNIGRMPNNLLHNWLSSDMLAKGSEPPLIMLGGADKIYKKIAYSVIGLRSLILKNPNNSELADNERETVHELVNKQIDHLEANNKLIFDMLELQENIMRIFNLCVQTRVDLHARTMIHRADHGGNKTTTFYTSNVCGNPNELRLPFTKEQTPGVVTDYKLLEKVTEETMGNNDKIYCFSNVLATNSPYTMSDLGVSKIAAGLEKFDFQDPKFLQAKGLIDTLPTFDKKEMAKLTNIFPEGIWFPRKLAQKVLEEWNSIMLIIKNSNSVANMMAQQSVIDVKFKSCLKETRHFYKELDRMYILLQKKCNPYLGVLRPDEIVSLVSCPVQPNLLEQSTWNSVFGTMHSSGYTQLTEAKLAPIDILGIRGEQGIKLNPINEEKDKSARSGGAVGAAKTFDEEPTPENVEKDKQDEFYQMIKNKWKTETCAIIRRAVMGVHSFVFSVEDSSVIGVCFVTDVEQTIAGAGSQPKIGVGNGSSTTTNNNTKCLYFTRPINISIPVMFSDSTTCKISPVVWIPFAVLEMEYSVKRGIFHCFVRSGMLKPNVGSLLAGYNKALSASATTGVKRNENKIEFPEINEELKFLMRKYKANVPVILESMQDIPPFAAVPFVVVLHTLMIASIFLTGRKHRQKMWKRYFKVFEAIRTSYRNNITQSMNIHVSCILDYLIMSVAQFHLNPAIQTVVMNSFKNYLVDQDISHDLLVAFEGCSTISDSARYYRIFLMAQFLSTSSMSVFLSQSSYFPQIFSVPYTDMFLTDDIDMDVSSDIDVQLANIVHKGLHFDFSDKSVFELPTMAWGSFGLQSNRGSNRSSRSSKFRDSSLFTGQTKRVMPGATQRSGIDSINSPESSRSNLSKRGGKGGSSSNSVAVAGGKSGGVQDRRATDLFSPTQGKQSSMTVGDSRISSARYSMRFGKMNPDDQKKNMASNYDVMEEYIVEIRETCKKLATLGWPTRAVPLTNSLIYVPHIAANILTYSALPIRIGASTHCYSFCSFSLPKKSVMGNISIPQILPITPEIVVALKTMNGEGLLSIPYIQIPCIVSSRQVARTTNFIMSILLGRFYWEVDTLTVKNIGESFLKPFENKPYYPKFNWTTDLFFREMFNNSFYHYLVLCESVPSVISFALQDVTKDQRTGLGFHAVDFLNSLNAPFNRPISSKLTSVSYPNDFQYLPFYVDRQIIPVFHSYTLDIIPSQLKTRLVTINPYNFSNLALPDFRGRDGPFALLYIPVESPKDFPQTLINNSKVDFRSGNYSGVFSESSRNIVNSFGVHELDDGVLESGKTKIVKKVPFLSGAIGSPEMREKAIMATIGYCVLRNLPQLPCFKYIDDVLSLCDISAKSAGLLYLLGLRFKTDTSKNMFDINFEHPMTTFAKHLFHSIASNMMGLNMVGISQMILNIVFSCAVPGIKVSVPFSRRVIQRMVTTTNVSKENIGVPGQVGSRGYHSHYAIGTQEMFLEENDEKFLRLALAELTQLSAMAPNQPISDTTRLNIYTTFKKKYFPSFTHSFGINSDILSFIDMSIASYMPIHPMPAQIYVNITDKKTSLENPTHNSIAEKGQNIISANHKIDNVCYAIFQSTFDYVLGVRRGDPNCPDLMGKRMNPLNARIYKYTKKLVEYLKIDEYNGPFEFSMSLAIQFEFTSKVFCCVNGGVEISSVIICFVLAMAILDVEPYSSIVKSQKPLREYLLPHFLLILPGHIIKHVPRLLIRSEIRYNQTTNDAVVIDLTSSNSRRELSESLFSLDYDRILSVSFRNTTAPKALTSVNNKLYTNEFYGFLNGLYISQIRENHPNCIPLPSNIIESLISTEAIWTHIVKPCSVFLFGDVGQINVQLPLDPNSISFTKMIGNNIASSIFRYAINFELFYNEMILSPGSESPKQKLILKILGTQALHDKLVTIVLDTVLASFLVAFQLPLFEIGKLKSFIETKLGTDLKRHIFGPFLSPNIQNKVNSFISGESSIVFNDRELLYISTESIFSWGGENGGKTHIKDYFETYKRCFVNSLNGLLDIIDYTKNTSFSSLVIRIDKGMRQEFVKLFNEINRNSAARNKHFHTQNVLTYSTSFDESKRTSQEFTNEVIKDITTVIEENFKFINSDSRMVMFFDMLDVDVLSFPMMNVLLFYISDICQKMHISASLIILVEDPITPSERIRPYTNRSEVGVGIGPGTAIFPIAEEEESVIHSRAEQQRGVPIDKTAAQLADNILEREINEASNKPLFQEEMETEYVGHLPTGIYMYPMFSFFPNSPEMSMWSSVSKLHKTIASTLSTENCGAIFNRLKSLKKLKHLFDRLLLSLKCTMKQVREEQIFFFVIGIFNHANVILLEAQYLPDFVFEIPALGEPIIVEEVLLSTGNLLIDTFIAACGRLCHVSASNQIGVYELDVSIEMFTHMLLDSIKEPVQKDSSISDKLICSPLSQGVPFLSPNTIWLRPFTMNGVAGKSLNIPEVYVLFPAQARVILVLAQYLATYMKSPETTGVPIVFGNRYSSMPNYIIKEAIKIAFGDVSGHIIYLNDAQRDVSSVQKRFANSIEGTALSKSISSRQDDYEGWNPPIIQVFKMGDITDPINYNGSITNYVNSLLDQPFSQLAYTIPQDIINNLVSKHNSTVINAPLKRKNNRTILSNFIFNRVIPILYMPEVISGRMYSTAVYEKISIEVDPQSLFLAPSTTKDDLEKEVETFTDKLMKNISGVTTAFEKELASTAESVGEDVCCWGKVTIKEVCEKIHKKLASLSRENITMILKTIMISLERHYRHEDSDDDKVDSQGLHYPILSLAVENTSQLRYKYHNDSPGHVATPTLRLGADVELHECDMERSKSYRDMKTAKTTVGSYDVTAAESLDLELNVCNNETAVSQASNVVLSPGMPFAIRSGNENIPTVEKVDIMSRDLIISIIGTFQIIHKHIFTKISWLIRNVLRLSQDGVFFTNYRDSILEQLEKLKRDETECKQRSIDLFPEFAEKKAYIQEKSESLNSVREKLNEALTTEKQIVDLMSSTNEINESVEKREYIDKIQISYRCFEDDEKLSSAGIINIFNDCLRIMGSEPMGPANGSFVNLRQFNTEQISFEDTSAFIPCCSHDKVPSCEDFENTMSSKFRLTPETAELIQPYVRNELFGGVKSTRSKSTGEMSEKGDLLGFFKDITKFVDINLLDLQRTDEILNKKLTEATEKVKKYRTKARAIEDQMAERRKEMETIEKTREQFSEKTGKARSKMELFAKILGSMENIIEGLKIMIVGEDIRETTACICYNITEYVFMASLSLHAPTEYLEVEPSLFKQLWDPTPFENSTLDESQLHKFEGKWFNVDLRNSYITNPEPSFFYFTVFPRFLLQGAGVGRDIEQRIFSMAFYSPFTPVFYDNNDTAGPVLFRYFRECSYFRSFQEFINCIIKTSDISAIKQMELGSFPKVSIVQINLNSLVDLCEYSETLIAICDRVRKAWPTGPRIILLCKEEYSQKYIKGFCGIRIPDLPSTFSYRITFNSSKEMSQDIQNCHIKISKDARSLDLVMRSFLSKMVNFEKKLNTMSSGAPDYYTAEIISQIEGDVLDILKISDKLEKKADKGRQKRQMVYELTRKYILPSYILISAKMVMDSLGVSELMRILKDKNSGSELMASVGGKTIFSSAGVLKCANICENFIHQKQGKARYDLKNHMFIKENSSVAALTTKTLFWKLYVSFPYEHKLEFAVILTLLIASSPEITELFLRLLTADTVANQPGRETMNFRRIKEILTLLPDTKITSFIMNNINVSNDAENKKMDPVKLVTESAVFRRVMGNIVITMENFTSWAQTTRVDEPDLPFITEQDRRSDDRFTKTEMQITNQWLKSMLLIALRPENTMDIMATTFTVVTQGIVNLLDGGLVSPAKENVFDAFTTDSFFFSVLPSLLSYPNHAEGIVNLPSINAFGGFTNSLSVIKSFETASAFPIPRLESVMIADVLDPEFTTFAWAKEIVTRPILLIIKLPSCNSHLNSILGFSYSENHRNEMITTKEPPWWLPLASEQMRNFIIAKNNFEIDPIVPHDLFRLSFIETGNTLCTLCRELLKKKFLSPTSIKVLSLRPSSIFSAVLGRGAIPLLAESICNSVAGGALDAFATISDVIEKFSDIMQVNRNKNITVNGTVLSTNNIPAEAISHRGTESHHVGNLTSYDSCANLSSSPKAANDNNQREEEEEDTEEENGEDKDEIFNEPPAWLDIWIKSTLLLVKVIEVMCVHGGENLGNWKEIDFLKIYLIIVQSLMISDRNLITENLVNTLSAVGGKEDLKKSIIKCLEDLPNDPIISSCFGVKSGASEPQSPLDPTVFLSKYVSSLPLLFGLRFHGPKKIPYQWNSKELTGWEKYHSISYNCPEPVAANRQETSALIFKTSMSVSKFFPYVTKYTQRFLATKNFVVNQIVKFAGKEGTGATDAAPTGNSGAAQAGYPETQNTRAPAKGGSQSVTQKDVSLPVVGSGGTSNSQLFDNEKQTKIDTSAVMENSEDAGDSCSILGGDLIQKNVTTINSPFQDYYLAHIYACEFQRADAVAITRTLIEYSNTKIGKYDKVGSVMSISPALGGMLRPSVIFTPTNVRNIRHYLMGLYKVIHDLSSLRSRIDIPNGIPRGIFNTFMYNNSIYQNTTARAKNMMLLSQEAANDQLLATDLNKSFMLSSISKNMSKLRRVTVAHTTHFPPFILPATQLVHCSGEIEGEFYGRQNPMIIIYPLVCYYNEIVSKMLKLRIMMLDDLTALVSLLSGHPMASQRDDSHKLFGTLFFILMDKVPVEWMRNGVLKRHEGSLSSFVMYGYKVLATTANKLYDYLVNVLSFEYHDNTEKKEQDENSSLTQANIPQPGSNLLGAANERIGLTQAGAQAKSPIPSGGVGGGNDVPPSSTGNTTQRGDDSINMIPSSSRDQAQTRRSIITIPPYKKDNILKEISNYSTIFALNLERYFNKNRAENPLNYPTGTSFVRSFELCIQRYIGFYDNMREIMAIVVPPSFPGAPGGLPAHAASSPSPSPPPPPPGSLIPTPAPSTGITTAPANSNQPPTTNPVSSPSVPPPAQQPPGGGASSMMAMMMKNMGISIYVQFSKFAIMLTLKDTSSLNHVTIENSVYNGVNTLFHTKKPQERFVTDILDLTINLRSSFSDSSVEPFSTKLYTRSLILLPVFISKIFPQSFKDRFPKKKAPAPEAANTKALRGNKQAATDAKKNEQAAMADQKAKGTKNNTGNTKAQRAGLGSTKKKQVFGKNKKPNSKQSFVTNPSEVTVPKVASIGHNTNLCVYTESFTSDIPVNVDKLGYHIPVFASNSKNTMIGVICIPRFTNSRQVANNPIKQPNYFTGANLRGSDNKNPNRNGDVKSLEPIEHLNIHQIISPIGNMQCHLMVDLSPFRKHEESQHYNIERVTETEITNIESSYTAGVSSFGSQSSYASSRMATSRTGQLFGKKKDAMPISSPLSNLVDVSTPAYHNLFTWEGRIDLNLDQNCFLE